MGQVWASSCLHSLLSQRQSSPEGDHIHIQTRQPCATLATTTYDIPDESHITSVCMSALYSGGCLLPTPFLLGLLSIPLPPTLWYATTEPTGYSNSWQHEDVLHVKCSSKMYVPTYHHVSKFWLCCHSNQLVCCRENRCTHQSHLFLHSAHTICCLTSINHCWRGNAQCLRTLGGQLPQRPALLCLPRSLD